MSNYNREYSNFNFSIPWLDDSCVSEAEEKYEEIIKEEEDDE